MLQITSKTEYGLRCLLLLARQGNEKSLSIPDISQREGVPRHYAQQIMLKLGKAGLVKSIRGTQGGFVLGKTPAEISVGAILRVLEGVPFQDRCDHFNKKLSCGHLSECSIRPVWQTVSQRLWETLDGITLHQLMADEKTVSHRLISELPVLSHPPHP
jgi:Rrf2 family transcriptional regulator, cysteine metabolism repressor